MKRILCPIDFSEASRNAISYTAKLAQKLNAEMRIFNVKSIFDFAPMEMLRGTRMTLEGLSEEMDQLSREITNMFNVPCYPEIQPSGRPLSTVISERARDFDLIAMGTNGTDDLYQFLTGSNTYNVIKKASVPLLFIPENCIYADITRAVFAVDYLKERKVPLGQLGALLEAYRSELHVLQVVDENNGESETQIMELESLAAESKTSEYKFTLETIHSADIPRSIHSYVLRNEADLLVLHAHRYNFIERIFHKSVTKVISGIAEYPVMVVHE